MSIKRTIQIRTLYLQLALYRCMFSFCAQKARLEVDSINGGGDDEDLGFGKITEIALGCIGRMEVCFLT